MLELIENFQSLIYSPIQFSLTDSPVPENEDDLISFKWFGELLLLTTVTCFDRLVLQVSKSVPDFPLQSGIHL